jgi:hypothetical protein
MSQIILRFDEQLAMKVNKKALEDYQQEVAEEYMLLSAVKRFEETVNAS